MEKITLQDYALKATEFYDNASKKIKIPYDKDLFVRTVTNAYSILKNGETPTIAATTKVTLNDDNLKFYRRSKIRNGVRKIVKGEDLIPTSACWQWIEYINFISRTKMKKAFYEHYRKFDIQSLRFSSTHYSFIFLLLAVEYLTVISKNPVQ